MRSICSMLVQSGTSPLGCRTASGQCPLLRTATNQRCLTNTNSRSRQHKLQVQAIGFDFGDEDRAPKKKTAKASALGTLAASLLVLGPVMRGAVGEAFLAALASTHKLQATNKDIFAAYSRFYSLLLTAGFDSWEDYLLDQILLGRENAFARAVAQGQVGPGAPVLRAVAYDLDMLQEAALTLDQFTEYIGEIAPTASRYWRESASSISLKSPSQQLPRSSTSSTQVALVLDPGPPAAFITRPPAPEELAEWKAAISSKPSWAEAVPLLQRYYSLHGFGITSRNSALRWTKGAFEEGSEGTTGLTPLTALEPLRARLAANTLRHCEGHAAHHVLLAGPSGTAKSWLLWEATLAAGRDKGLRVVDVPPGELPNLLEVARGCARYPRLRFILVADHVDLPLRGQMAADLMSGLSGSGPSGWPANTLLYMGASPTSHITYDAAVSRFGLVLTTSHLTPEQYFQTLVEVAAPVAVAPEEGPPALQWAEAHGGLTVRAAAQYVRTATGLQ